MDKDLICRVCSIELGIKRKGRWEAVATCPYCQEPHILFEAKLDNWTPGIGSSDGFSLAINPYSEDVQ